MIGRTIALLVAACLCASSVGAQKQNPRFNRDVRPILAENCFPCHGPDANKRKANLRLDIRDSALVRKAISPGLPDKSAVVKRILSRNPAFLMPPPASHKKLTPQQQSIIVDWIRTGATYEAHWAYIAPSRPSVPTNEKRITKSDNPIDRFIAAKLAERGLRASPEADRRTLIRRVYLDLIGIPPSPSEVGAFLADRSPNAFETVVDRLLASPHYGERMAMPWLDIVRYADTVGFHGDQNQNSWAYRDYVVKSFNENKQFDRFTIEQIAGDLLPNPSPEALTATCFNRLNMVTREGGAQPKEYMAKYAADRVRTVSMAWLGSTFGCAECHDHKFDPIKQRDFYSMAAFFADLKQWGVYADYGYTPNPDLRGIGNDHSFPPEIKVESPYLKQRIERNLKRIWELAELSGARIKTDSAAEDAFKTWRSAASEFLAKNPTGWAALPAEVLTAAGKPASGKAFGETQSDGSVLITADAPAEVMVNAGPLPGLAASIRLELLPHTAHGGSILRQGTGGLLRGTLTLRRADGTSKPLAVRHAEANLSLPRYDSSFEVLGIQSGWQLDAAKAKEVHDSTWVLDSPIKLEAGDRIGVILRGAKAGCVRISVSPFGKVPDDTFPDLAIGARQPNPAPRQMETYLRGTGWEPELYGRLKALEADIVACRRGITPVMVTESINPATVRVLPRGNWQDESGPVADPVVPHFLPQSTVPKNRRLTRLDLANWLVSPENPLTARMFVNRLWKQFFGTALSDKVEDLGTQGEWPTHPELLDWLAVEFMNPTTDEKRKTNNESRAMKSVGRRSSVVANPWSIKHIVRLIVTSATYRQSSNPRADALKVDPQNRLLASQNPRRLEAELVRDNALAISGLLNRDVGGPPCKPYQPAGYYVNLQFPDRDYIADSDDRQWRRGIYTHWQRTFLHPMLANFDAPSREDCIATRTVANTPQQSLTLLNDPQFVEAARAFASRLLAESGTDPARLERAYQIALARPIKPKEKASLLTFLARVRSEYRAKPEDADKLFGVGFSLRSGSDKVELAAWTSVCRVVLNLHETITRY